MSSQLYEKGTMYLNSILFKELPENFIVQGSLDLTGAKIKYLPIKIKIMGDLILGDCTLDSFPKKATVFGNVYLGTNYNLLIPETALIGGKIINSNGTETEHFNKEFKHIFVNNIKITYSNPKVIIKEENMTPGWYYPQITYYKNVCGFDNAASYTENNITYFLLCENMHDAISVVNYNRAKINGIEKYKDYDLNALRTVDELKEIYLICTSACEGGVQEFIEKYVDTNRLYSILDLRNILENIEVDELGAKDIFMNFFNPNKEA